MKQPDTIKGFISDASFAIKYLSLNRGKVHIKTKHRKKIMKKLIAILSATLFIAGLAVAHSGGTDSAGCHYDHKRGGYHCH